MEIGEGLPGFALLFIYFSNVYVNGSLLGHFLIQSKEEIQGLLVLLHALED